MKKIIAFILILTAGAFAQNQKLTLKESLQIGMMNSKDLKISQSKVISSRARITETGSARLPQLKLAANYTRLSSIPPFEVQLPFSPTPIQISPVILNNYNLKLSLQQPLFTGFRLSSLAGAADLNNKAEEMEYAKEKNEVAYKIQTAFWDYYKAEQIKKLIDEDLHQIKQHLNDTRNFLANGLATKNDLLKLEVEYSNVQLQKIEADNNLDIARIGFNQAIGITLDNPTEIDAQSIKPEAVDFKYNDLIEEAKNNRNELKAMQMRVQASQKGISAAKSAWFPSIFLTGNYYYSKPNQRIIPAVNDFRDTWDVGVSLSWDIFTWGQRSAKVMEAQQTKVQAETSLSQLNDAVQIEVYQSYLSLKKAYEKVRVSKLAVKQAEENYRIFKEKYNTQVASSTDLIDSETSLLQAKTSLNNSVVDYELAKVRLEKSLGKKIY